MFRAGILVLVAAAPVAGGVVISMPAPPTATAASAGNVTPLHRFGDADQARDRAGNVVLQTPASSAVAVGARRWDGIGWRGGDYWGGWGWGYGSPIIINNYGVQPPVTGVSTPCAVSSGFWFGF